MKNLLNTGSFLSKLENIGKNNFSLAITVFCTIFIIIFLGGCIYYDEMASSGDKKKVLVYEEDQPERLEHKIKQVDIALLALLEQYRDSIKLLDLKVKNKSFSGDIYQLQQLVLDTSALNKSAEDDFYTKIQTTVPFVEVLKEKNLLLLTIDGMLVYSIDFQKTETFIQEPQFADSKKPKLIIVIDDLGEDLNSAKLLSKLPFPITFSIWPESTFAVQVANMAEKNNLDFLIHMPMEPQKYPSFNPGKNALFSNMDKATIIAKVHGHLDKLPNAYGINNHMGSKFTESYPGMRAVLTTLKSENKVYLDSFTTSKSVAPTIAREINIPFYQRHIFIDNEKNVDAIVHQLRKAEAIAMAQGSAIAIGHPNSQTIEALYKWRNLRKKDVEIISLSKLKPRFGTPRATIVTKKIVY